VRKLLTKFFVLAMAMLLAMVGREKESKAAVKGELSQTTGAVAIGKSLRLKVKKKNGAKVTWHSTKKKVAKVSSNGKVSGLKKGKATIVAKVKKGKKSKKLRCQITVVKGAKKLTVLYKNKKVKSVTVEKFATLKLKAKIKPKKSNDIVTWTSEDNGVATVKDGVITGQYVGKTTIKAKTCSGKKVKIKVEVISPKLEATLKNAYKNDFSIGVAVNTWQMNGIGGYAKAKSLIKKQFDSITMENQMKPENILSVATKEQLSKTTVVINTTVLDNILKVTKENGQKLRAFCFVWHKQTPEWFFYEDYDVSKSLASKEVMHARLESYISQVFAYCQEFYPGVIYAWDVVNEALDDEGNPRTDSFWYKTYGDASYITDAFTIANKYAPSDVSLFYSDYNEYVPKKRNAIFNLVKNLYAAGICDGIAMQSHYTMDYPTTALVKVAIQKYNDIAPGKIQLQMTQMDIHNTYKSASGQVLVAEKYSSMMKMFLDQKRNENVNITNVTFWGLTDADSWLTSEKSETSYPLLFGGDYAAKSSYFAVLNAVKE